MLRELDRRRFLNHISAMTVATPWYLAGGSTKAQCVAAWQAKGATSLAASYSNLNNPGTLNLTLGTAPTWDAINGWKFDGTLTQYLKTNYLPASSNFSVFIRFSNATYNGATILGVYSTNYYQIKFQTGSILRCWIGGAVGNYIDIGSAPASGIVGLNAANVWVNAAIAGVAPAGSLPGSRSLILGALQGSSVISPATAYIQAVAMYSSVVPNPAGLVTAMNAL